MSQQNRLNKSAFESIIKAMGPDVKVTNEPDLLWAFSSKFYDGCKLNSASVFYRNKFKAGELTPSIHVILSHVGDEITDTNIVVGSYDEIQSIKKAIQNHLSV